MGMERQARTMDILTQEDIMIQRQNITDQHIGRQVYLDDSGGAVPVRVQILGISDRPDEIFIRYLAGSGSANEDKSIPCEALKWSLMDGVNNIDEARSKYPEIPEAILSGFYGYIEELRPTGGFLLAVLCNNLRESIMRADDVNGKILDRIVGFAYQHLPSCSWGSQEVVTNWLNGLGVPRVS